MELSLAPASATVAAAIEDFRRLDAGTWYFEVNFSSVKIPFLQKGSAPRRYSRIE